MEDKRKENKHLAIIVANILVPLMGLGLIYLSFGIEDYWKYVSLLIANLLYTVYSVASYHELLGKYFNKKQLNGLNVIFDVMFLSFLTIFGFSLFYEFWLENYNYPNINFFDIFFYSFSYFFGGTTIDFNFWEIKIFNIFQRICSFSLIVFIISNFNKLNKVSPD